MKRFLESVFTFLFVIIIVWGQTGGLYHTYTRHREQFWLAVSVPPIAWYRGVEMFWHNEYSGKKWDKTQLADTQTILFLVNSITNNNITRAVLEIEIDEFSNKIRNYPKNKKEIIKRIFDEYAEMQLIFHDDMLNTFTNYLLTKKFVRFRSARMTELEQKFRDYGVGEYFDISNKAFDDMYSRFQKNDDEAWKLVQAKFEEYKEFSKRYKDIVSTDLNAMSIKIFD